jgi:dipeptidyl aminopeptidase/acylaminoacyl peptidase
MRLRNAFVLGVWGLLAYSVIPAHAEAALVEQPDKTALVPVADFFRTPKISSVRLSPDGRHVAVTVDTAAGRLQLAVIDLGNLSASKVVASFSDVDITRVAWVNAQRLVYSVADLQRADRNIASGLWAVNNDGSDSRQLINISHARVTNSSYVNDRRLSPEWRLHTSLNDRTADVIVEAPAFNNTGAVVTYKLARLDTKTGLTQNLSSGAPEHVMNWLVDDAGQPVAITTWYQGRFASYLRKNNGWQLWEAVDGYSDLYSMPYWAGPHNELVALSRRKSDNAALFEVNNETLAFADKPLVNTPGYDFNGQLVYDRKAGRLLGVHYETDAQGTAWLDKGMQELQGDVDKLLPGAVNRIDCELCISVPTVLVTSSADRIPPKYYLYDRESKNLKVLGASRPWIQPGQMGLRDVYRFQARDKRSIPVLVTQPAGKSTGPRPAVVLVHGGPYERGTHWAWEPAAQFLASRGYMVIEPEFRGSTGYGSAHFRAGWKQWGLAMQDDVADAAQWAVSQGWVDPKRICIAGASYGGYAVLMGLIKTPELYQCGVEWVGVSDIDLMYDIGWSDFSDEWKQYGMPLLVGDQVKDAQQLKETSPLAQAHRLNRPLLMAYGGRDSRVPIKHGTAFRDAVGKTNPNVEWIVYPNEGHGWRELENKVDFWSHVEKFLGRNIGPSSVK